MGGDTYFVNNEPSFLNQTPMQMASHNIDQHSSAKQVP